MHTGDVSFDHEVHEDPEGNFPALGQCGNPGGLFVSSVNEPVLPAFVQRR